MDVLSHFDANRALYQAIKFKLLPDFLWEKAMPISFKSRYKGLYI